MREDDDRKLDHATLEALRIRAVALVQTGQSPEVVGKVLGLNRTTIYDWLAHYRRDRENALNARPVPGRPAKLTGRQLKWIFDTEARKNRMQLKFEFALWTHQMLATLIKESRFRKFGQGFTRRICSPAA
jgi:transposase